MEDRPPAISARTGLCGIVLHPAGHTRSPAMHNAAFRALGLDAVYVAFDVPPEQLGGAMAGARALGVRQLAVSIPHKQAVIPHLDALDDRARAIGAVNTATLREGGWLGSNTDWLGAVRALERATPLEGRSAVVLGAGGAARAVVFGLRERGARVHVLNRSVERARTLAAELGAQGAGALSDLADVEHEVLVNTTSVGLGGGASPVEARALRAGSVVMDAVYEPEQTQLLRDAQDRGAIPVPGKWMLVYQAAEQLRLWSGKDAPVDVMANAFDASAGPRAR